MIHISVQNKSHLERVVTFIEINLCLISLDQNRETFGALIGPFCATLQVHRNDKTVLIKSKDFLSIRDYPWERPPEQFFVFDNQIRSKAQIAKPRTGAPKNKAWRGQAGAQPQPIASFAGGFKAFPKIKMNLSYQVFILIFLSLSLSLKKKGKLINC